MATERELSDFLKSVEKRAFKRSVYHVRNEESALDIVQDAMMKLAEHYGDKPSAELPMLFQRILSNCTLDYFRRNKVRKALFSNLSDFESQGDGGEFDLLETYEIEDDSVQSESPETSVSRKQILMEIEKEILQLVAREFSSHDIAEQLFISERTVETHRRNILAKTNCKSVVGLIQYALRHRLIS